MIGVIQHNEMGGYVEKSCVVIIRNFFDFQIHGSEKFFSEYGDIYILELFCKQNSKFLSTPLSNFHFTYIIFSFISFTSAPKLQE
jgi:hypothetical protein